VSVHELLPVVPLIDRACTPGLALAMSDEDPGGQAEPLRGEERPGLLEEHPA
jgi:hypothetical protein